MKDNLLADYLVLDLCNDKGLLCGKILADLGADVLIIENPEGNPARTQPPFYKDIPHTERSLSWFYFCSNKRGITLDIAREDGKEIFKTLVRKASFVVESFHAGYMDEIGLGYTMLSQINPSLIMISITPFGSKGPYCDFQASDLILEGMGGLMSVSGDSDRAPLRCTTEQWHLGAVDAAMAALAAHYYRGNTGRGQYIDVSIQESLLWGMQVYAFWEMTKTRYKREGDRTSRGNISFKVIWKCSDGYISWRIFVAAMGRATKALVEWMDEENMAGNLKETNWENLDMNFLTQQDIKHWEELFAHFFLKHTKSELQREAVKRGLMLFPVADAKDLIEEHQLKERHYWEEIAHNELGDNLLYPGAFLKSDTGDLAIRMRAPLIGEHNEEVYVKELGIPREELLVLKQNGVI